MPTMDETTADKPCRVETGTVALWVEGRRVALTPQEIPLFDLLREREGQVVSRADLLAARWGPGEYANERSVDTAISRLRSKVGPALDIRTEPGGYRLVTAHTFVTSAKKRSTNA